MVVFDLWLIHYQAAWSMANSSFSLSSNRKLTVGMNASMFHLKMIDHLEETVRETSDLSIYWYVINSHRLKRRILKKYLLTHFSFYSRQMEIQWKTCIEMPIQVHFVFITQFFVMKMDFFSNFCEYIFVVSIWTFIRSSLFSFPWFSTWFVSRREESYYRKGEEYGRKTLTIHIFSLSHFAIV